MLASTILITSVLVTITVTTFVLNLILLLALTRHFSVTLTFTFALTLTFSLVTCDLILSMISMPLSILDYLNAKNWKFGDLLCRIYMGTDVTLCSASILHLVALSADRYLAICRPFVHRLLTTQKAKLICLIAWTFALCMGILLYARKSGVVTTPAPTQSPTSDAFNFTSFTPCDVSTGDDYVTALTTNDVITNGLSSVAAADSAATNSRVKDTTTPHAVNTSVSKLQWAPTTTTSMNLDNDTTRRRLNNTSLNNEGTGVCSYFVSPVEVLVSITLTCFAPLVLIVGFHVLILRQLCLPGNTSRASDVRNYASEVPHVTSQPHDVTSTSQLHGGVSDDKLVQNDTNDAVSDDKLVQNDTNDAVSDDKLVQNDTNHVISDDDLVQNDTNDAIGDDELVQNDDATGCRSFAVVVSVVELTCKTAMTMRLEPTTAVTETTPMPTSYLSLCTPCPNLASTRSNATQTTVKHIQLNTRKQRKNNTQAVKTLMCLVMCFLVCWFPFLITSLVMTVAGVKYDDDVFTFIIWLGYVNSTINPILLYRFNSTIRGAIRRLLRLER